MHQYALPALALGLTGFSSFACSQTANSSDESPVISGGAGGIGNDTPPGPGAGTSFTSPSGMTPATDDPTLPQMGGAASNGTSAAPSDTASSNVGDDATGNSGAAASSSTANPGPDPDDTAAVDETAPDDGSSQDDSNSDPMNGMMPAGNGGAMPLGSGGSNGEADVGADDGAGGHGGSTPVDSEPMEIGNPSRVLLCDEGNRRVVLLDLENAQPAVWRTAFDDTNRFGDSVRDLQLVGDDRVAVSTARGYVELNVSTGEIVKEVNGFSGVESLRRLPDGNTVLGANANGGVTLQELDSQDEVLRQATFASYNQLRLFRRTEAGTFLLASGTQLAEVNWDGETVWDMTIPDGDWVYQGVHLADGSIAVTSGYGSALLVIDPDTKAVLTTIGGKNQADAASITPNFYAGFQVLPNGHFVVTNWEGHGGGNGSKGVQLLEYDEAGTLVWQWRQDPALISSLHHVIVLDGLDTALLHDDVGGALAPVSD